MKIKYTYILTFVAVIFMVFPAAAQTDSCIVYLKNANSNFEMRDFDGTIKLLQTALNNCNLDRTDKIQAHKLLALSYLAIDNLESADKEAEAIMKINPNYTPDKFKDDPKLSALFDKYKPVPVLRIGVCVGMNNTKIDVQKTHSIVHNDDDPNLGTYNGKSGFQLGISGEYRTFKNLWLQLEGQFRQSTYKHSLNNVENSTIDFKERLSYFEVPLSIKYYILDSEFTPYVETGATFSFLSDALSTTTRDDQKDLVNRTDYRNSYMTGFFGGVGVAYKFKSLSAFIAYRYNYFGDNVNKEGTRYADAVNVFKYYYIDDDFRMNNWQINVGVNYSIFYKNLKVK